MKLDSIYQDVRYTLRTLRRDPSFTIIALLILALGIGANTAVFSVVNTVLLRPLPFREAGQLVWLEGHDGDTGLSSQTFPVGVFELMRSRNHTMQDVTGYFAFFGFGDYKLTGRGEAERLVGLPVAQNFFPMLGVQPAMGRLFVAEECTNNGRKAILLSHALWKQRFGADEKIVGRSLTLDNQTYNVVGVLPATFDFGSIFSPGTRVDFYLPALMDQFRNSGNTLSLVGRLKPGVSLETARSDFAALAVEIGRDHPQWKTNSSATVTSLKEYVSGKIRRSLIVVWFAVGLILLIVCVNLANLMLARSSARAKEFAVRGALGAGRFRVLRQLLTESLILSVAGAVLGLALAFALTHFLANSRSIALPLLENVRVDGAALGFTMLLAMGSAIVFGLAPGLKLAGSELHESLKESSRGASEGRRQGLFRASLVVCEVALACVLLVGAGLLLRSFMRLLDVDMGFQPARAIALRLDYDDGGSQKDRAAQLAKRSAFFQSAVNRVRSVPGIEGAGLTDSLPLGQNRSWGFKAQGKVYGPQAYEGAFVYVVSPGYMESMGMRVRAGRDVQWNDTDASDQVLVINETTARQVWPGQDPVGKTVILDGPRARRVIGVVADVRETSLEKPAASAIFLPVTQTLDLAGAQLIIRTRLPIPSIASGVRAALQAINPNQPVNDFHPLQELVDRAVSPRRFFLLLVAAFALLGLLLASLGIYGVISYSVSRQTREIGIRMALGASPGNLRAAVIGRTLQLVFGGIALGTAVSLVVARLIASLLFGVRPSDPLTFAAMVAVLGAVSLVAGYVPARRASKVDPMVALRD